LLLSTRSNPGYANGYLFYVDEKRSLRASPVDISKGTTPGEPQVVAIKSVSSRLPTGRVLRGRERNRRLQPDCRCCALGPDWYDRAGKELGHVGDVGVLANPALSPDNSLVAVTSRT